MGNLVGVSYNNLTERLFRVPDAVGNLYKTADRKDRTYGPGGRLLEAEGTRYGYDEEGNLTEKIEVGGKKWLYEWNANGSLKMVTRPDRQKVGFEYDAIGRRTAKIFDKRITRWVWDGNTPLHEWSYPLDERPKIVQDEFGMSSKEGEEPTTNLITWVFEEGTFKPVAKLTEMGYGNMSIITDHLGTPVQMYGNIGNRTWAAEFDIYGKNRTFEWGSLTDCPFRFQGQYEDAETGLYYNRFRYYSPDEGMYLSQDPIGLQGGMILYGYVHDSNRLVDIYGLTKYVVYQGIERGTGKVYTGRTSGSDDMSTRDILNRRHSNHHRDLGPLQPVYETDNYKAVRGGEQFHIDETRKTGKAADQINGISPRNVNKRAYEDAFKNSTNPKKTTPLLNSVCN